METIEISKKQFLSLPVMKKGVVHINKHQLYKYSPDSINIIDEIDSKRHYRVMKHLSVPQAYLYYKKQYFGFSMKYYKKLKQIKDCLDRNIIKSLDNYIIELLKIIEELNSLNLIYWDFHERNILADANGNPFLVDIDSMSNLPTSEELHYQQEYFTEFLLNLYIEKRKSVVGYLKTPSFKHYFSDKSIKYFEDIINLGSQTPDLPYCILEDLKDKEKILELKKHIK